VGNLETLFGPCNLSNCVLHTSDGLDSTQVENKRIYLGVRGLTVQYPDGMRAGIRMAAIRSELDPPCAKIGSNIAC